MYSEKHGEYELSLMTVQSWVDDNHELSTEVLKQVEQQMVDAAKKAGMRTREIDRLEELNAIRRILAKEDAFSVLVKLNSLGQYAIYKAIEKYHAALATTSQPNK